MFRCSASGEKLPPLTIGRSKKPHAFTKAKLDFKKAGCTWVSNKKAWITGVFFAFRLTEVNKMKKQIRKILLWLDNASGHKVDSPSHVKFVFLLPKQTSRIQPLVQGIIKAFQARESAAKAEHRRANRKNFQNLEEYKESLTALHSVKWIMKRWADVDDSTIRNCFRKSGAFDMAEKKSGNITALPEVKLEESVRQCPAAPPRPPSPPCPAVPPCPATPHCPTYNRTEHDLEHRNDRGAKHEDIGDGKCPPPSVKTYSKVAGMEFGAATSCNGTSPEFLLT
ncbi:hypothetical protein RvY_17777 [Ramazzottius varieornatus]|uniref:DDE-1 domain-containing protein n=1 Tax=Ramazzottius varieornatus TaxID=947166 RepID=A0A1D1WA09_RAMVA|nr:hypothetical protein RvY_17777 [Ramazzottius varieornatus]